MGSPIDLIPFLARVMEQNTRSYRSDFDFDVETLTNLSLRRRRRKRQKKPGPALHKRDPRPSAGVARKRRG